MNSKPWLVILFSVLSAVLQTIIPILENDVNWYTFVMPVATVILGTLSRNMSGVAWTISGIVSASLAGFYAAHPSPEGISIKYVLSAWVFPILLQVIGAIAPKQSSKPEDAIDQ